MGKKRGPLKESSQQRRFNRRLAIDLLRLKRLQFEKLAIVDGLDDFWFYPQLHGMIQLDSDRCLDDDRHCS